MTEKYTGKEQDRRYTGQNIDVTYNVQRCIHAAACVRNLPAVFNRSDRPWIRADGSAADDTASIVLMCPSGALHFQRKDGGWEETAPETNRILARENGPLQVSGVLALAGTRVDVANETRATLCRCGESSNKPFCDDSHFKTGFHAPDAQARSERLHELAETAAGLTITVEPNGPYAIDGNLRIVNEAGETLFTGQHVTLCRCGNSGDKPFCDGSHSRVHFEAE